MTDDKQKSVPPVPPPHASPHSKSTHDPVSQFLKKSASADPGHHAHHPPDAAHPHLPHSPPAPADGNENLADAPHIPGYQITARLGEGGMGVVWAGIQLSTKRKVALKFLSAASFGSSRAKARFVREVELAASLQHPNIARVYDSGLEKGVWYYAMELVEGVPLDKFVKENHLSLVDILKLMQGVCEGMQHAHQKGVIHRDLKPSNILVSKNAQAHILDFGLAKDIAHDAAEAVTQVGDVSGTPAFMSPEQADGKASSVDTRTDVYSLGVILYTVLTRKTPHDLTGTHVSVIRRIAEEEVIRPRLAMPALDHELEALLLKALARKPEERYATAAELAADIANYLAGDPLTARPATMSYFLSKRLKKNWLPVTIAASVLIVFLALAVGSYISVSAAKTRADRDAAAAKVAKDQATRALTALQEREDAIIKATNDAQNERNVAQRALADFQAQKSRADAAAQSEAIASAEAKNANLKVEEQQGALNVAQESAVAAGKQAELNLADAYTLRGLDANSYAGAAGLWFSLASLQAAADPDRQFVNMIRYNNWSNGQFEPIAGLHPTHDRVLLESERPNFALAFHPTTARYLISTLRGATFVWDVATEQSLKLPANFGRLSAAAWFNDGASILVGTDAGQVAVLSFPAMQVTQRWNTSPPAPITSVAVRADAKYIAAGSGKRLLIAKPAATEIFPVDQPANVRHVQFSPLGLLAAATADDSVRLFTPSESGTTVKLQTKLGPVKHIYGQAEFFQPPIFVKNGQVMVTIRDRGYNGEPGIIAWYDTDAGRELLPTIQIPQVLGADAVWQITPTPDSKSILVSGPNGHFIDATSRILGTKFDQNHCVAINPAQNRMAIGLMDRFQAFGLTPNKQGSRANTDVRLPAGTGALAYSHDGKFLAAISGDLVRVWSTPSREAPIQRTLPFEYPNYVVFSKDGLHLLNAGMTEDYSKRHIVQVASAEDAKSESPTIDIQENLLNAAFSPDASLIAVTSGIKDEKKQLRFYDWHSGSVAGNPIPLPAISEGIAYAPDGKAIAVYCKDGQVLLFDTASGSQLRRLSAGATTQSYYYNNAFCGVVGFTHDGNAIATLGTKKFQLWDRASGNEKYALTFNDNVFAWAESPDGSIIAVGAFDGTLRVIDAATGKDKFPPVHHPREIAYLTFSPDGNTLCSTCFDCNIRLWDAASGKLKNVFATEDRHHTVAYTPDGRWLVTDVPVHVWDAASGFSITPNLLNGHHYYVEISPDGRRAALSGIVDTSRSIDLSQLTVASTTPTPQALAWSELLASSEVLGSNLVALDNDHWLERWHDYWKKYPRVEPLEFTESAAQIVKAPPQLVPSRGLTGVGTWNTNAQFKDIVITSGNKTVYQSDFTKGTDNAWRFSGGDWRFENGALHQTKPAVTDCRAYIGDVNWADYTISLKAQKFGGQEGFLVLFHVQDQNTYLWWNLGGWKNTRTVIEKSAAGQKSVLGDAANISIQENRWYDLRVEIHGNDIKCFLDGKLVNQANDPGNPKR